MKQPVEQLVLDHLRSRLGDGGFDRTIVYVGERPEPAGGRIRIGDIDIEMPWEGYLVFIDLEPGVNWSHRCAYLAVRSDGGQIRWFDARMPPFLKADAPPFRLLRCGPSAPQWAVATEPE